jgi:DNA repair protein RadC
VESTRGLASAGKLIGIEVVDHVVLGKRTASRDRDFVSLRELNLM